MIVIFDGVSDHALRGWSLWSLWTERGKGKVSVSIYVCGYLRVSTYVCGYVCGYLVLYVYYCPLSLDRSTVLYLLHSLIISYIVISI